MYNWVNFILFKYYIHLAKKENNITASFNTRKSKPLLLSFIHSLIINIEINKFCSKNEVFAPCVLNFHFVYFIFLIISYLLIFIVIIIVWLSIFSLKAIKEGNYKMKEEYIVRKNSRYFEDLENNSYQQQKNRTSGFYWKKKKKRETNDIKKNKKKESTNNNSDCYLWLAYFLF